MDSISVNLIAGNAAKAALDSLRILVQTSASYEFQSGIIIDNLNNQVTTYKQNERDLKSAVSLLNSTINDQKIEARDKRRAAIKEWFVGGGLLLGVGGVGGWALAHVH